MFRSINYRGFKALLQSANFIMEPYLTLNRELHKNSIRIMAPNSVDASQRKHLNKVFFQKKRLAKFYQWPFSGHVYRNANATNHNPNLFTQFLIFQIEATYRPSIIKLSQSVPNLSNVHNFITKHSKGK